MHFLVYSVIPAKGMKTEVVAIWHVCPVEPRGIWNPKKAVKTRQSAFQELKTRMWQQHYTGAQNCQAVFLFVVISNKLTH